MSPLDAERARLLVRPTLDTKFHIDFQWWEKEDRDWEVYLRSHLCPQHQATYADMDPYFQDSTLIGTLVGHFRRVPSPFTGVLIEHHGGAIRRVPEDATAFRHRAPEYNLTAPSAWTDAADSEMNIRWTRELLSALQPFSTGEYYANYNSETESEERLRAAYGANYSRLAALKAKYDPTNFFRLNHNVAPGAEQRATSNE